MIQRDAIVIASFLGAVLVFLLLYLDKYEREPISRIAGLYGFSILATGLFGVVKYYLMGEATFGPVIQAYLVAGALEEALKFGIFLLILTRWKRWIDEEYDCLVYLGVIALGFSVQENIGYYIAYSLPGFMNGIASSDFSDYHRRLHGIALVRALPGHLLFDMLGAAVVARGYRTHRLGVTFLGGYLLAVFLHGTWNLLGGIAFVVYAALLAGTTAVVLFNMIARSRYWKEQKHWTGVLKRLRMQSPAAPSRGAVTRSVAEIQKGLAKLPMLPGVSQAAIFERFREVFREEPAVSENGLKEIERLLAEQGARKHDWLYWSLLVMLFLGLGLGCTWISLVLNAALIF